MLCDFYRPAPAVPHHKHGSDKGKVDKSDGKSELDLSSSFNSSVNSVANSSVTSPKSFHSLSSPPSISDVFLYEDVDGLGDNPSYVDSHSRESSSEKDHASLVPQKMMVSSESVPSFANHVAPDKPPGKKRGGLKKLLTRSSKRKLHSQPCKYMYNNLFNAPDRLIL